MPDQLQTNPVPTDSILRLANILVATDFSAESLKGLRYGIAFARQFNAVLWIVHVVEPPPAISGFEAIPITIDDTQLMKSAERRFTEFVAGTVPSGVPVKTLVRHGSAFEEVVAAAKAQSIDLLITSTHGHTGLKRVLFGSTAERIVQHAPCPMLVVREREHEFIGVGRNDIATIRLRRILVPVDFSECSRKAVQYAIALAKQFNAQIFWLHAIDIPYETSEVGIVIETDAFRKRMHEEAKRQMDVFLQEVAAPISEECTIKLGTPYREIIQIAGDREIDLIILGTHGRSGIRHFLLGSTTERVVRHAHCPVLVVREREREFIA